MRQLWHLPTHCLILEFRSGPLLEVSLACVGKVRANRTVSACTCLQSALRTVSACTCLSECTQFQVFADVIKLTHVLYVLCSLSDLHVHVHDCDMR